MSEKDIEFFDKLCKMLEEKHLKSFWLPCDVKTFKPITGKSTPEIHQMLKEKKSIYGGRKIAAVSLNTTKRNKIIFSVKISIFEIEEDGTINRKEYSNWGLKYNYHIEDMLVFKFTITNIMKLIHLCANKIIRNDSLNGYEIKYLLNDLKNNNIDLDNYKI